MRLRYVALEAGASVVQHLVDRTRGNEELGGELLGRDSVDRDGDQYGSLACRQLAEDAVADLMEQLTDLCQVFQRAPGVDDHLHLFGIFGDPCRLVSETPANADRGLELGEPPRPRPELAFSSKVIELAQQDEKGVACGLGG